MWPTDIEYVIVSINMLTAHKSIQHMHISIYKNKYVTSQYHHQNPSDSTCASTASIQCWQNELDIQIKVKLPLCLKINLYVLNTHVIVEVELHFS
jgi:hypothetical protein